MRETNFENTGWIVSRSWMLALEEVAADFHDAKTKRFLTQAYEHAVEAWIGIWANEYDMPIPRAKTIREAIENYIEFGVKVGLFRDASQFEISELGPNHVQIEIHTASFYHAKPTDAKKLLGVMSRSRIGCFAAAVKMLAGITCDWEITEIDAEQGCKGYVERI